MCKFISLMKKSMNGATADYLFVSDYFENIMQMVINIKIHLSFDNWMLSAATVIIVLSWLSSYCVLV